MAKANKVDFNRLKRQSRLQRAVQGGRIDDLLRHLETEDPFLIDSSGRTALHYAANHANQAVAVKCVRILLTSDQVSRLKNGIEVTKKFVDIQDNNKETALHLAAKRESKKIVEMLIFSAADVNLMSYEHKNQLQLIYSYVPSAMVSVFDAGFQAHEDDDVGAENLRLVVDFGSVMGWPSEEEKKGGFYMKETELIAYTLDNSPVASKEILTHPMLKLFLELKWKKIHFFFWFSVIFHIAWLLLFTAVITEVYLQSCPYPGSRNLTAVNDDFVDVKVSKFAWFSFSVEFHESTTDPTCVVTPWTIRLLWVLWAMTGIVAAKEFFEMFSSRSLKVYVRGPENTGQWLLILFIVMLSWPVVMAEEVRPWNYEIAAVGIFVAWSLILSQIGKHPKLGLHVEILSRVLKNFLWFMLVFASLLIAFALSLSLLLPGNDSFVSLPLAFMKIIVMMTGELDYDDLFSDGKAAFPVTARLTYVLFVVVVSITLFNLLIGFTVSDIQGLQKKAEVNRLSNQVEQIFLIESFLLAKPLQIFLCRGRKFLKRFLVLPPPEKSDTDTEDVDDLSFEISINDVPLDLQKSVRYLAIKNSSRPENYEFETDDENDEIEAIVKTVVREFMKKKGLL